MIDFSFFEEAIRYARTFVPKLRTMHFPYDLENRVFHFTTANTQTEKFEYLDRYEFYVLMKDNDVFVVDKSLMEKFVLKNTDVLSDAFKIWGRTKED